MANNTLNVDTIVATGNISSSGNITLGALPQDNTGASLPLVIQSSSGELSQLHGISASSYSSNTFSMLTMNGGNGGYGQSNFMFQLNGQYCLKFSVTGTTQSSFNYLMYNFNTSAPAMMVQGSNNYMSIGCSNPNYPLDIVGHTNIRSGGNMLIQSGTLVNYSAQVNPGNATLATGTKGLESVTYRSAITSFIATSATSIVTVPTGFMLMIKSIDYVTITIGTAGATQAVIEVGNTTTANAYLTSYTLPTSTNVVGGNVRIINSNVCIAAGTTLNFTITTAANATSQTGVIMIEGVLIPTT